MITEKYYGYLTQSGYKGWVGRLKCWMFFPTEQEYIDFINDDE